MRLIYNTRMSNTKIHFKNLDSLRTFAFLGVYLYHFNLRINPDLSAYPKTFSFLKTIFSFGDLGVNLFFVLSGFLITYLLLSEESLSGKYNIPDFWIRRILRIWPLYFGVVLYGFLLFALFPSHNSNQVETANIFYYISFLPNFNIIHNGYPLNPALTVLWSVGVEEQFYLLWPLLLFNKRTRPFSFPLIIAASLWFRYTHMDSSFVLKFHSFSLMNEIACGACLAWICFQMKLKQDQIKFSKSWILLIYMTGFFCIFSPSAILTNSFYFAVRPLLISLFFCFILFEQIFIVNKLIHWGRIKFIEKCGKYTYGLYCLHMIGILVGFHLSKLLKVETNIYWVITGELLLSLSISMLFSYLSYNYLEKPFLSIKKRFAKIENRP